MIKPIKSKVHLTEYGRNVQVMVNYLKTIEDKDKRNEQARLVVAIMGNVYPTRRDTEEFQHMLWDHLFMIADFDIDVESPFPMPTPDVLEPKPQIIPYTQSQFSKKQYGFFARKMILETITSANASIEEKDTLILCIAKYMRQQAYNYNHEYPTNETIATHINTITSDYDYTFDVSSLEATKVTTSPQPAQQRNNKSYNNKKQQAQQQQQQQQRNNKNRKKK